MKKAYLLLAVSAIFLFPVFAVGAEIASENSEIKDERILSFHSDIKINEDASILVTETITVNAKLEQIKHGIYRDFPTKYKDRYGNNKNVDFTIVDIERDGQAEDYHTEEMDNGIRVYFGNKDVFLNPGLHTYKFTYTTNRQIGYFAEHDELYFNVTGNGWVFPIDSASASVTLQGSISANDLKASGYTGPQGSKDANLSAVLSTSSATYQTTRPLYSYEGLTIVFEFPKGLVHRPTNWEQVTYFFRDNFSAWISILLIFFLFLYYFITWKRVGVDPKSRSIIAQYEPPRDFSPAEISFLSKMGFANTSLVAMIINMGVKGHIKIDELKVNYRLTKLQSSNQNLSADEQTLFKEMFKDGDTFEINRENYLDVMKCEAEVQKCLKDKFKDDYFVRNWKYIWFGILLSLGALLVGASMRSTEAIFPIVFLIIWLSGWSFFAYALLKQGVEFWPRKKSKAISSFLTASGLICIELIIVFLVSTQFSVALVCFAMGIILLNVFFGDILKRRTPLGREVQDEIEGFKMFLSVTEKDRMNFHNPPERTPELFEKFLPYALALGVENKWAEQFEEVFQKAFGPDGYHPNWYHGHNLSAASLPAMASAMSNGMSRSISSSSVPPGSSSGSGGGGSSGGGGGGGGGGGW